MLRTSEVKERDPALDVLFTPGERWGWEWRDVNPLYFAFPVAPPPAPQRPQANSVGGSFLGLKSEEVGIAIAIFLVPAFVLGLLPLSGDTVGLLALLSWIVGYSLLFMRVRERRGRERVAAGRGRGKWEQEWQEITRRHQAAVAEWQSRAAEYHAQERSRLGRLPEWGAVRPSSPGRRIDVYGGTTAGWQALTTTIGTSLLGSGESLFVLDFSEADVAAMLFAAARQAGVPTKANVLPQELETSDVLAGLEPMAIKETLVEALHADRPDVERTSRSVDDRILTAICDILAPRVTLERIHAALRVLLRQEPPPDGGTSVLTDDEWNRLTELFNDEYRQVITTALVHLDSQLAPLQYLGRRAQTPDEAGARCTGIAISRDGGSLVNELLVDILVQTTIRKLRSQAKSHDSRVLVVIAADLLKKRHLERMDDLAAGLDTRVIYLFRHLRDDVLEVAGGGGAIAAVMRPGGHKEAEQAANLIGREHRFELAQTTHTAGISDTLSWTDTEGISKSWATFIPVVSDSTTAAWGESKSSSEQEATTRQRVHEYVMEPEVLRALPPTAVVLVEFSASAKRARVRLADCDPALASLPRVSAHPFDEDPVTTRAGG